MSISTLGTAGLEKKLSKKRVVVVGGGVAGALVAKKLENDAEVLFVDAKDFFEVPYAGMRCIVQPSFGERSCFFHSDYLGKSVLVTNSAKSASAKEVVTDHGEHIDYDFLVIATGTAYNGPLTRRDRLEEYMKLNQKLASSKAILIVGGGPVGVELAGEVATDFPAIKITLVHSGSRLLEFIGPIASKKTLDWLKARNVEVILDDRVEDFGKSPYTTKQGKKIEADAYFMCVGKKVGNSWLKDSDFKDLLEENGRIKVEDTLQLPRFPNVFAVGDITNIKEIKQGYFASLHADVAVQNIRKLIKDPKCKQLKKYKPSSFVLAIVTLGRYSAICHTPCCAFSGKIPAAIKCNDLFVTKTRGELGLKTQKVQTVVVR